MNGGEKRARIFLLAFLALLPFLPALYRGDVLVFRDHADYFVPLRWFTCQALRSGHLPLWNPYNGLGESWIGNPQTALFYPPALLFVALPFARAYSLFLALHLFLFGFFTARLFRRFASPQAATLGAAAAMLSGPAMSLLDVQNNLLTLTWIPLALELSTRDGMPPRRRVAALAVVFALLFLGGEPFYTLLGGLAAMIASVVAGGLRRAAQVAGGGAMALVIVMPQLVPFVELLRGSDRTAGLPAAIAFRHSAAASDWLALIVPLWSRLATMSEGFIPSLYITSGILGLALLALLSWRTLGAPARRAALAALATMAFAFVYALGSHAAPVAGVIRALHLDASRYPSRVIPFAALALAALAAAGADAARAAGRRARLTAIGFVALIALAALTAIVPGDDASRVALLVDAVAGIAIIAASEHLARPVVHCTVTAVVVTLLVFSAAGFFVSAPLDALRTSYAPRIDRRFNVGRVVDPRYGNSPFDLSGKRRWMSGYLNLLSGVHDLSTPAPVIPRAFERMEQEALSGQNLAATNLLSVGTVLTTHALHAPGFVTDRGSGAVLLYRNTRALPMATLWDAGAAANGPHAMPFAGGFPRFVGTNRVELDVVSPRPALALLNQLDAPGWSVTVDGRAATPRRVHTLFRGVDVTAGTHHIVWSYSPPGEKIALALSLCALLACVLLAGGRAPLNPTTNPTSSSPAAAE